MMDEKSIIWTNNYNKFFEYLLMLIVGWILLIIMFTFMFPDLNIDDDILYQLFRFFTFYIYPLLMIFFFITLSVEYPFKISITNNGFIVKTINKIKNYNWDDISELYIVDLGFEPSQIMIMKNKERFGLFKVNKNIRMIMINEIRKHNIKEIKGLPPKK